MKVISLFSGIGGLEYGLSRSGFNAEFFCEIDPIARSVLKHQYAGATIVNDINEITSIPSCDLIAAGFPCQDLSQAGTKTGITGSRSGLVARLFYLMGKLPHKKRPEWLVIENVPYMLRLDRGKAMSYITEQLIKLKYRWAYRVVDARAFGLPQRRPRVILVAAKNSDPNAVLFSDVFDEPDLDGKPGLIDESSYYGFYWTEGSRGVGWAREGVPPIKCGSTLGIASPPAVWIPHKDYVGTINIEDAEALQGFPPGWTDFSKLGNNAKSSLRWRLIGNAVSTKMSSWVGQRLKRPGNPNVTMTRHDSERTWPDAACGDKSGVYKVHASRWASETQQIPLSQFLRHELKPLSVRATSGFLSRAKSCTNVVYSDRFIASLIIHSERGA
jgi:DNA (cytosine-5)-methyltransferase 1